MPVLTLELFAALLAGGERTSVILARSRQLRAFSMLHPTWPSTLTTSLTTWGETSGTLR